MSRRNLYFFIDNHRKYIKNYTHVAYSCIHTSKTKRYIQKGVTKIYNSSPPNQLRNSIKDNCCSLTIDFTQDHKVDTKATFDFWMSCFYFSQLTKTQKIKVAFQAFSPLQEIYMWGDFMWILYFNQASDRY